MFVDREARNLVARRLKRLSGPVFKLLRKRLRRHKYPPDRAIEMAAQFVMARAMAEQLEPLVVNYKNMEEMRAMVDAFKEYIEKENRK